MRAFVVAAALATAACGRTLVTLPSGAGTPLDTAAASAAVQDALATCTALRSTTAEAAVSGSTLGHRIRARLLVGVATPASVRLEAVAGFGPPLFFFVATGTEATLLLPQDNRVLERGDPAAVLDALAGVALNARDLEAMFTGCAPSMAVASAVQFGDRWLRVSLEDQTDLYLNRPAVSAGWGLSAFTRRPSSTAAAWRVEYGARSDGIPRQLRVTSLDQSGHATGAFDLQITLSQVEKNVALDAAAFRVDIPAGAERMSLEELRTSSPLHGR